MIRVSNASFIEEIAPYVQKYAPKYGICVCSPIIAQACLESAYGTSNKAKHHNYFGLKYRDGRLTVNNGTFVDRSSEQRADGTRYSITDQWYNFDTMEAGVEGYFQFINISNYSNVKGVTDPEEYLQNIKADEYATSINYVDNVMAVIRKWDLTRFDSIPKESKTLTIIPNSGFQGYNVSVRSSKIQYIVMHYVGDVGSAKNNVAYFNGGNRSASADYFVGHDGIVYQYNPDILNKYTWHCGGGRQSSQGGEYFGICKNANSIGIEMCCRKTDSGRWYFEDATVQAAISLVKMLMRIYGMPAANVIRHFDVTGKYCPNVHGWIPPTGSESVWQGFKRQIGDDSTSTDTTTGSDQYMFAVDTVKSGSSGSSVLLLQRLLRAGGFRGADNKALTLDGDCGNNTVAAIKKYQKKKKLTVDGIAGTTTWKTILGL